MTTLKKLTYQVMRMLSNGPRPKDSKLSERYLNEQIIQVTNSLLKLSWFNDKNQGANDINHMMIATYDDCTVLNDTVRRRNYIELPAYPVNLPNQLGIQQVRPLTGKPVMDVAMPLIMPNELEIFRGLLYGSEVMKDQFTAEPDRKKIWFSEKGNKTLLQCGVTNVEVKMVIVDPSQLEEDEPFPVSANMEIDILKEVLVMNGYTPNKAADLINNDSPQ